MAKSPSDSYLLTVSRGLLVILSLWPLFYDSSSDFEMASLGSVQRYLSLFNLESHTEIQDLFASVSWPTAAHETKLQLM